MLREATLQSIRKPLFPVDSERCVVRFAQSVRGARPCYADESTIWGCVVAFVAAYQAQQRCSRASRPVKLLTVRYRTGAKTRECEREHTKKKPLSRRLMSTAVRVDRLNLIFSRQALTVKSQFAAVCCTAMVMIASAWSYALRCRIAVGG